MAGLAVAVSLLGACGRGPQPAAVLSTPPSPVASTLPVVPWADIAFTPVPPPPETTTTTLPAPTSPPCRASQLSVAAAGTNGATGNTIASYRFTNTGTVPCSLAGYPGVILSEPGLPPVTASDSDFIFVGRPADISPGASSGLALLIPHGCDGGGADPGLAYHTVTVTLPGGGSLSLPGFDFVVACGLTVSAFAVPPPPYVPPPDPIASLTASLSAPAQVRAGDTLVYTVTLTNPTAAAIALDPCPPFGQAIAGLFDGTKVLRQLNCAQAQPIPAGGTETFSMHLAVAGDAPSGDTTLTWGFIYPGEPASAHVPLRVVADPSHPTTTMSPTAPRPCGAPSGPPPCGPGTQVGASYPYAIDTRCGLGPIYVDGTRLFPDVGDTAGQSSYGWPTPIDVGTIVVNKPAVSATFADTSFHSVTYGPHTASSPAPAATC